MLVAVVGPSGAGKDTLLAGARARLAGDARFRFVRRGITRPADPGGEDHDPLTQTAFARLRDAGGFALWWEAHGLLYGIPRDIEADLAAGRVVVANLSRAARLAREAALPPGLDVATVMNDADVGTGVARVLEVLSRAAAGAPPPGRAQQARPG